MLKRLPLALLFLGLVFGSISVHSVKAATVTISQLSAGDLIRGQTYSAVYYFGADGFRYVFPNDKTYFTWYTDFSTVKWLSDADLGKIQIGGNVTYKPGVKMIKINTDPKTYAVDAGGTLRWVDSETTAKALYGANWNKMIDDMPDGFFGNYTRGEDLSTSSDISSFLNSWTSAPTYTIDKDKDLVAPTDISITSGKFTSNDISIKVGQTVRWTNNDTAVHSASADDLTWGSGTMQPGDFWVRRFKKAGIYTYFDSYNPSMTGTITVQ